ncbi:MAG: P1 family peptidase [Pseudoxanthomonas suwonensis]|nr:P1 family peptidase [Pseudoxanthomonas suwonensis]
MPAAIEVGNGYGKLVGSTQVRELGELESPVLLTGTLNVWRVADAAVSWMLEQPGMAEVRSLNMVVGETNDGLLNDIRARPVAEADVRAALDAADTLPPQEGAVGAGAGTVAFGWKGGIGTSSRRAAAGEGDWHVGVLVQSNYGGALRVDGVPVPLAPPMAAGNGAVDPVAAVATSGDGSVIVVLATDAPLDARQLQRLARRALLGIGRTGSVMSHGSGDYVIAFSTVPVGGAGPEAGRPRPALADGELTRLFQAAVEATEEGVLNSLFRARTVHGHRGSAHAIPIEQVQDALRRAGRLRELGVSDGTPSASTP